MIGWAAFQGEAPEIARIGHSLLFRSDGGEVAILATVDGHRRPAVAPVCPIFSDPGVYLSVNRRTPKYHHLATHGRYALHAQVGADDVEFQMSGSVRRLTAAEERARVVAAIPFPSFDPEDPLFELLIERAVAVRWTDGRSRKQAWRAG